MNTLARVQKQLYDPSLSEEEYARCREEFIKLYFSLRERNEASFLGQLSLQKRRIVHPLLTLIHIIKNRVLGFSHRILYDRRNSEDRPVIFAVTHVGKFDIEVLCEILKEHCYILSGDYENVQGTIVELFFSLNGVFYFNEQVREDRILVQKKMITHLKDCGNIMFFPEGAWNLSPNRPVLPCYWGIIDIARKGNAIIVPIAAEQYGKHFDINIGNNFDVQKYSDTIEGKTKAIADLRDKMASLKWEIWEQHPSMRRDIPDDEWEKYLDARFHEWTYFSLDYVDTLIYKPRGITEPEEAFAHLDKLIPSKENAFLFRKR